jgi:primary-amine oxidase
MPCETIQVKFKPVDFFQRNPAIDVPPSTQAANKSTGLNGVSSAREAQMHHQAGTEAVVADHGKASARISWKLS